MSNSLDKLKALSNRLESKLHEKTKNETNPTCTPVKSTPKSKRKSTKKTSVSIKKSTTSDSDTRDENIKRVELLYKSLKISEKSPDFSTIFEYKAMNLSGIGLKEEDFGEIREGKYIQIIAITYEPDKYGKKKAKNISLGYFGKAETLNKVLKNQIIEFVLRWRYEKAFQNVKHYKDLIAKVDISTDTLF